MLKYTCTRHAGGIIRISADEREGESAIGALCMGSLTGRDRQDFWRHIKSEVDGTQVGMKRGHAMKFADWFPAEARAALSESPVAL